MRLKLLVFLGLVCAARARESRNLLKWLFGGESSEQHTRNEEVLRIGENVRTLPSQSLLRRTNQLSEGARETVQTRGLPRGRVLNRPAPGGPVRGYKRPPSPRPRPLDRVPAPVIYSSYASSVVQGRGQEEQKRIQETFDKYERLNEISDEDIDIEKVEQTAKSNDKEEDEVEAEERVVEATVELIRKTEEEESEKVTEEIKQKTETTSTTETTTEQTSRAPAKDADFTSEKVGLTESPAINEIFEFEIVDDENPYLPAIPENLDEDIHGAHDHTEDKEDQDEKVEEVEKKIFQAGYKEIAPVEAPARDRYEQRVANQPPASTKQNIYPLGKPQRPPLKPSRPAQRPSDQAEGSLFDFLPSGLSSLWGGPSRPPVRPRRPIGPPPGPRPGPELQVTQLAHSPDYPGGLQAPLLLKVDTDPDTEAPVRPETQETPTISSRIDTSLATELQQDQEAFVVLPSLDVRQRVPLEKKTSQTKNVPKRPRLPPPRAQRFPRPPPPRPLKARLPSKAPLPMLSQPVIGLPQVPAGRKQAPFLPKRPLLPPQLPKTFPGAPKQTPKLPSGPLQKPQAPSVALKKPLGPPPQKTEQNSQTFLKKPLENFPKKSFVKPKPVSLSPVIARLTQQTKVQEKKPFDFRPNGSSQQPSPFISNISSMLNRFLGTTPGPAPAPSLPSLVEETEFADIVTGYKPSDKNENESRGESADVKTTTTTPDDKTTTIKPLIKVDEYDEIDSLTAPVPAKPNKLKKPQFPNPNWKKDAFKKRPPPPAVRKTAPVPITTTAAPTTTTTTARPTPVTTSTTAYPAPIQALVQEYQEKGHVIEQPTYPKPVLQAIQRDFQQKEKIFQQFVTFDETDKAFIPNKEVVNSDWNLDVNTPASAASLSDKILVYQTLGPVTSPAPVSQQAPPSDDTQLTSLQEGARRSSAHSFPQERNAEGGFQPMLRPLHQPLLSQHLAA